MTDHRKLKIFIVILTYNSKQLVLSCLSHLKNLDNKNFLVSLILVDNGSTDGTIDIVKKKHPEVILIDNKINYGFAKGINYGLRLAYDFGADWILMLNDDTIPLKSFLKELIAVSLRNNYYIAGPKIKTKDNKIWSLGGKIDDVRFSGGLIGYGEIDNKNYEERKVDFISGTAMLVKRKIFEKIGFLDEDYFLYYDDVDFCYRASQKGFYSYIIPKSELIHLETVTIGKNSAVHLYHAAKSRLIFILKRAPFRIKIQEFFFIVIKIFTLILEKNRLRKKYELLAIKDFLLLRFGQKTEIRPNKKI